MLTRMIFWGTILAGLAVVFGAFGAHIIQPYLAVLDVDPIKTPPMQVFKTGVEYQFFHAIAIIITGILYKQKPTRMVSNAALIFIIGIILFSGSLYVITFGYVMQRDLGFIGAITPLGGLAFIIAWGLLAYAFSKKTHTRS
jgi:uncharacterized membrane protein YgdD (TMEM256/DUF423 family)